MAEVSSRRLVSNTLYSAFGFAAVLAINFFATPYIIARLGSELYGSVWSLFGVLTAYIGLTDLGIGSAFVKHLAEFHAQDKPEKFNEVIATGIGFYAILSVPILVGGFLAGAPVLRFIGVPEAREPEALFVLTVSLVIISLANILSVFNAVLIGLQRFDLSSRLALLSSGLGLAGAIISLESGWGVRGMIISNLIVMLLSQLLAAALAFRLYPPLRVRLTGVTAAMFRQLASFSLMLHLSKVSQVLVFQTDKVIALKFFGASYTTYFDVATRASQLARNIPMLLLSSVIPAAAVLDAQADRTRLIRLYERSSRYLILISAPLTAFLVAFSEPLLGLWMNRSLSEESIRLCSVLTATMSIGLFFNIVTGGASSIAVGLGRTDMELRYGILLTGVHLAAVFGLMPLFGHLGIALGGTLSLFSGSLYFMWQFHRALKIPASLFLNQLTKPVLASVISGIVTAQLFALFAAGPEGFTVAAAAWLTLAAIFFGSSYVFGLWLMNFIERADVDLLGQALRLKVK